MPLYDFHCKECLKNFESLSKPFEPVECAHCKGRETERTFSTTRAQYKIKGNNECSTPKRLKMENLKVY